MKKLFRKTQRSVAALAFIASAAAEQAKLVAADPDESGITVAATGVDRATPCAGVVDFVITTAPSRDGMSLRWTSPSPNLSSRRGDASCGSR